MQANLDRLVFALIRRKAAARRALDGSDTERRLSPRAEIGDGDRLTVLLLPDRAPGVLARNKVPEDAVTLKLADLSTTGCALICPDPCSLQPDQVVRLRLVGGERDIELLGKILHRE